MSLNASAVPSGLSGVDQMVHWLRPRARKLARVFLGSATLFLLVFLIIPTRHRATVIIQPSTSSGLAGIAGKLADISSRFGINPQATNSSIDYFALTIKSDTVLRSLLHTRFVGSTTTRNPRAGRALYEIYRDDPRALEERMHFAVEDLREVLTVRPDLVSGTIRLTIEDEDPHLAIAIARALVQAANARLAQLHAVVTEAERRYLEGALSEATGRLRAAEDSLTRFRIQNRAIMSPTLSLRDAQLTRELMIEQESFVTISAMVASVRLDQARATPVLVPLDPGVAPRQRHYYVRKAGLSAALAFLVVTAWIAMQALLLPAQGRPTEAPYVVR